MAEASGPYGRRTQRAPAVKEVHVVWITAGLGCDGDSVSITAATQPSLEDVILGGNSGVAEGAPAQPGAGVRSRRRVHEILVPSRRGAT